MSQENVEVVRRAIGAFNRRDVDALARDSDSQVEIDWSRSRGLEVGLYRGDDAVQGFLNTFFDMFDEVTLVPDEFIAVGDDVVVPNETHLRGRDGIEVRARSGLVVTVRGGRIVRWTLYQERADALEAAGRPE